MVTETERYSWAAKDLLFLASSVLVLDRSCNLSTSTSSRICQRQPPFPIRKTNNKQSIIKTKTMFDHLHSPSLIVGWGLLPTTHHPSIIHTYSHWMMDGVIA